MTNCFAGTIKGLEKAWFLGDSFCYKNFEQYYYKAGASSHYLIQHYEVSGFLCDGYQSQDKNIFSRLRNVLANALEQQVFLPKLIVLVPDDDILCYLVDKLGILNKDKISYASTKLLDWLMKEHDKLILQQKDNLPLKSKKYNFPQIVWIEAPLHDGFFNNELRAEFNNCLKKVGALHNNVSVLELKKIWDQHDSSLYLEEAQRYTSIGFRTYWDAVDRTLRFCDTTIIRRVMKAEFKDKSTDFNNKPPLKMGAAGKPSQQVQVHLQQNRFKWRNPDLY